MKVKKSQTSLYGYFVNDGDHVWIGYDDLLKYYENDNKISLNDEQLFKIKDFLDFLNDNKISVDEFDDYYFENFNKWD